MIYPEQGILIHQSHIFNINILQSIYTSLYSHIPCCLFGYNGKTTLMKLLFGSHGSHGNTDASFFEIMRMLDKQQHFKQPQYIHLELLLDVDIPNDNYIEKLRRLFVGAALDKKTHYIIAIDNIDKQNHYIHYFIQTMIDKYIIHNNEPNVSFIVSCNNISNILPSLKMRLLQLQNPPFNQDQINIWYKQQLDMIITNKITLLSDDDKQHSIERIIQQNNQTHIYLLKSILERNAMLLDTTTTKENLIQLFSSSNKETKMIELLQSIFCENDMINNADNADNHRIHTHTNRLQMRQYHSIICELYDSFSSYIDIMDFICSFLQHTNLNYVEDIMLTNKNKHYTIHKLHSFIISLNEQITENHFCSLLLCLLLSCRDYYIQNI